MGKLEWAQASPDRWEGSGSGYMTTVMRATIGGMPRWYAVISEPFGPERARSNYYATRGAAQRWVERSVR